MLARGIPFKIASVGFLSLLLAMGCASTQPADDNRLLVFPPPPAEPRIQFLTWASGAEQVVPTRTTLDSFLLGDDELDHRILNKPYGVAARDGVLYVCDTKGLALLRMDFKNQSYSVLGVRGPGRLRKPVNVLIDPAGFKFVADPLRKQVVVFSPDDKYVTAFTIPEPCRPVDIALYENELYVLDNDDTSQIVVLDRQTGKLIRTFGSSGSGAGQFKMPSSICIGPEGYLYVSDTLNWRIQKLTREGEEVWVKGTAGYLPGQFGRPKGLRIGPDGVVYVVDAASEVVQMFNSEGETLMHLGGPGNEPGALTLPSSLAVDATSIPYFADYIHEEFDAEYLLFVVSQYGEHLINVYAFGSFPDGYRLAESEITAINPLSPDSGIGAVNAESPPPDVDHAGAEPVPEEKQDEQEGD